VIETVARQEEDPVQPYSPQAAVDLDTPAMRETDQLPDPRTAFARPTALLQAMTTRLDSAESLQAPAIKRRTT
jgi:hypothetical protein